MDNEFISGLSEYLNKLYDFDINVEPKIEKDGKVIENTIIISANNKHVDECLTKFKADIKHYFEKLLNPPEKIEIRSDGCINITGTPNTSIKNYTRLIIVTFK